MTVSTVENLTLNVTQEVRVHAALNTTFDALLEQMGPANQTPEGEPLPMKIELHPGGRWFRDLGNDNGHLWGHVQAIKRPTLLEITGAVVPFHCCPIQCPVSAHGSRGWNADHVSAYRVRLRPGRLQGPHRDWLEIAA